MFNVDTKNSICVFVKLYLCTNKSSTGNFYLCHKYRFMNTQIGFWLLCNVYLRIHLKKSLFRQKNTQKTVFISAKEKKLCIDEKPSFVYLCIRIQAKEITV